jgi:glycosyltransferase involved in cell wall biosynthesis
MPQILKEFPNASLVFIGKEIESAYARRLQQEIQTLGLEKHISLKGFLPDAGQYFECFDICVVPSIQSESFGIVAIEAMRYHKPVVTTSAGGLREVLIDGESGFQVPPQDPVRLAEAILKLLRSPELQKSMGEKAYERFIQHFTVERMAQSYYRQAFPTDQPRLEMSR